jgi:hypothetical protein
MLLTLAADSSQGNSEHWSWTVRLVVAGACVALGIVAYTLHKRVAHWKSANPDRPHAGASAAEFVLWLIILGAVIEAPSALINYVPFSSSGG